MINNFDFDDIATFFLEENLDFSSPDKLVNHVLNNLDKIHKDHETNNIKENIDRFNLPFIPCNSSCTSNCIQDVIGNYVVIRFYFQGDPYTTTYIEGKIDSLLIDNLLIRIYPNVNKIIKYDITTYYNYSCYSKKYWENFN